MILQDGMVARCLADRDESGRPFRRRQKGGVGVTVVADHIRGMQGGKATQGDEVGNGAGDVRIIRRLECEIPDGGGQC